MAPYYPPPDTNKLLHPLLACLPMAFISSQPPPALFPILSPILRQRVKLLSETRSTSEGSWISLLCWDTNDGAALTGVVEKMSFEAHPVSGELEFGDIERARYKRLDEETLQAQTELTDLGLTVIYTWCVNDAEGGEDGWRISEFKPLNDNSSQLWYNTFSQADENYKNDPPNGHSLPQNGTSHPNGTASSVNAADENEDDYWSQYDQRQTETPDQRQTPRPGADGNATKDAGDEEQDYYDRYDTIQPEMDAEDPSEDKRAIGESSLHGNVLLGQHERESPSRFDTEHIIHTRPSSSNSSAIAQLEQSAEHQSQAEVAIQQHISSSIKSLYRLTKVAGIESSEFRRIVLNELDCLSLMDEE